MGLFGSAFNNLNGMSNGLNNINANIKRNQIEANTRNAGNTLEQIQANQEIEDARRRGDAEAERQATIRKQELQRQVNINNTVNTIQAVLSLIALLPFLLFFGYIIYILFFK